MRTCTHVHSVVRGVLLFVHRRAFEGILSASNSYTLNALHYVANLELFISIKPFDLDDEVRWESVVRYAFVLSGARSASAWYRRHTVLSPTGRA